RDAAGGTDVSDPTSRIAELIRPERKAVTSGAPADLQRAGSGVHPVAAAADVDPGDALLPGGGARARPGSRGGPGHVRRQPLGREHDARQPGVHASRSTPTST